MNLSPDCLGFWFSLQDFLSSFCSRLISIISLPEISNQSLQKKVYDFKTEIMHPSTTSWCRTHSWRKSLASATDTQDQRDSLVVCQSVLLLSFSITLCHFMYQQPLLSQHHLFSTLFTGEGTIYSAAGLIMMGQIHRVQWGAL